MTVSPTEFWQRVDMSSDGCWSWLGASPHYARLRVAGRWRGAHRVAWELTHGPIPARMEVCHTCDNPPCIRPAHLFLGTHADNMADMRRKGRNSGLRVGRGPQKLTESAVRNIRTRVAGGESRASLARDLGVSSSVVARIVRRDLWKAVA